MAPLRASAALPLLALAFLACVSAQDTTVGPVNKGLGAPYSIKCNSGIATSITLTQSSKPVIPQTNNSFVAGVLEVKCSVDNGTSGTFGTIGTVDPAKTTPVPSGTWRGGFSGITNVRGGFILDSVSFVVAATGKATPRVGNTDGGQALAGISCPEGSRVAGLFGRVEFLGGVKFIQTLGLICRPFSDPLADKLDMIQAKIDEKVAFKVAAINAVVDKLG